MGSKDAILKAIRNNLPQSAEHPSLDQDWTTYDDPIAQFSDVLASVGGECQHVRTMADVQAALETVDLWKNGTLRCHAVPGLDGGNFDLDAIEDPHDLEAVDFAVLPGNFAVAENAAVWVDAGNHGRRAIYFIAQHVALVVPASEVVNNLHEAYKRLDFQSPRFGLFISGPSKTADIEQSLVIGAHGARSQIVFLVDELTV